LTENLTEKIYSLVLENTYQSCDGLFVSSYYIKDSLVCSYETESNHVLVMDYDSKYPFVNRSVARKNNILFVGVEFERKDGTQLLHLFQKMRQYVPDLELTIVGRRFNPCPNIISVNYLGKITDNKVLSDVYLNTSVFVLHPKLEAFGLVFLEAMSHGVPCIGTKLDAMAVNIEK
jgi:glycosyltransferase involved in cell wall biosynthesis